MATTQKRWHIAQWGTLAWIETGIKLAAHAVAIVALLRALSGGPYALPEGWRLAQFALMGLMALGLVGAIFDRILEREIIAMAFVILNNVAHWGMAFALTASVGPGALLPLFCALMLAGDLVKLVFLKTSGFGVRDIPRPVLYLLTGLYVGGYALVLLLELLR